jgi:hypothetical protein
MTDRVLQACDICRAVDVDPRHHQFDPRSGGTVSAHPDCCAGNGCADCAAQLDATPKGSRSGAALIAYREELMSRPPKE